MLLFSMASGLSDQADAAAKSKNQFAVKADAKVVDIKGKINISIKKMPKKDIPKKVSFKSSKPKVATVNKNGVVTGKKAGTVKITAVSKKKKKIKSSVTLKVKDLKSSRLKVTPSALDLRLKNNRTKKIKVTVMPKGVYCPVKFRSLNPQVAKIKKDGTVMAVSEGTTVVTVKSKQKNKKGKFLTAKVTVKVKAAGIPEKTKAQQNAQKSSSKPSNNNSAINPGKRPIIPVEKPKQEKLADGTWYGTGSDGYYYEAYGPNIVKAEISNGKITEVSVVKRTEDHPYEYGEDILKSSVGKSDVSDLRKQLKEKAGDDYDAVSGATRTAEGHLSALENAIERSRKYHNDKKEQKIAYMDFEPRPDGQAIGKTLDLSNVVFRVHFIDGSSRIVPYSEFADHGITASPDHGSALPEVGKFFMVHFKQNDSLIDIPLRKQAMKERIAAYATHAELKLKNGQSVRVPMDDKEFVYKLNVEDDVESAKLFHGSRKIADGVKSQYATWREEWEFEISKDTPLPEGNYTHWGFHTYRVIPNNVNAGITEFAVDTKNVKMNYNVGERLDLSDIEITTTNLKGKQETIAGWDQCIKKGFTAAPDNGYYFQKSDAGEKTVTIKYSIAGTNLEQTFNVNVCVDEANSNVPAMIKITSGEDEVLTLPIDGDEFVKKDGRLTIRNVEISEKYKNWTLNDFQIHVTNADGEEINVKPEKMGVLLQLNLPGYTTPDEEGKGYVMIFFKYV